VLADVCLLPLYRPLVHSGCSHANNEKFDSSDLLVFLVSLRAYCLAPFLYALPGFLRLVTDTLRPCSSYETIKTEMFEKRWPNFPRTLAIVIAACVGDTLGAFALTPAEVVKSKTQAGLFQSSAEAAVTIFRRGGLRGFYQGHIAALCRDVPFRAVQLSLYENARQRYSAWLARHRGREMVPLENLLMGASIGMATAATTTPLDVVRTRMMSQSPGAGAAYANAWDCLSKTVRGEGFLALYKGLGPRMLLIGPSAAVFFVAYEASKKFFRVRASKLVACNLSGMRRTTKATGAMSLIR
jgi:Mitochondrial carrier protein